MSKDEILVKMREILSDTFELDADRITGEARLFEDLDLDSIDAVDLIVKLQQLTGKKIDPESFKQVRTVQNVVDAIHSLMEDGGSRE